MGPISDSPMERDYTGTPSDGSDGYWEEGHLFTPDELVSELAALSLMSVLDLKRNTDSLLFLLESAIRMTIKEAENTADNDLSEWLPDQPEFNALHLMTIKTIVEKAAAHRINLFSNEVESTVGNRLRLNTTPREYHRFVQLMLLLGKESIFNDPAGYFLNTAVHDAVGNINLLPATIDLLAEECHFDFELTNRGERHVLHVAPQVITCRETLEKMVHYGGGWTHKDFSGNTPLHTAAIQGNTTAIKYFLSLQGTNVNDPNTDLQTPLHLISNASCNFKENLNILVNAGANPNAVDTNGNTPLFHAIIHMKSLEEVKEMIKLGCDWEISDKHGLSILHICVLKEHYDCLKYFLSFEGTNVNARDSLQRTPLICASSAQQNFKQMIFLLKNSGANVNAADQMDMNIVHYAARDGKSKEKLQFLVEQIGCNWEDATIDGDTGLHLAVKTGNLEAVQYFLSLGARVSVKNSRDEACPIVLLCYAEQNFEEILHLLMGVGADINSASVFGNTLLLGSILMGRSLDNIKEVVRLGGNLTAKNVDNRSVLHLAVLAGNTEVLEYLLDEGADVNLKDNFGNTPLPLSLKSGWENHFEIIELLMLHGATLDVCSNNNAERLLLLAEELELSVEAIDQILDLGISVFEANEKGQTLLHIMTKVGSMELVTYLVSKGALVNMKDSQGQTPAHLCVVSKTDNFCRLVELLWSLGANVNAIDNSGRNVVLTAAAYGKGKKELIHLLNLGAHWELIDKFGQSILHILTKEGNVEALKFFLSLGADVTVTNNLGETPLHCVTYCKKHFIETVNVLIEGGVDVNAVDINGNNVFATAGLAGRQSYELLHLMDIMEKNKKQVEYVSVSLDVYPGLP